MKLDWDQVLKLKPFEVFLQEKIFAGYINLNEEQFAFLKDIRKGRTDTIPIYRQNKQIGKIIRAYISVYNWLVFIGELEEEIENKQYQFKVWMEDNNNDIKQLDIVYYYSPVSVDEFLNNIEEFINAR